MSSRNRSLGSDSVEWIVAAYNGMDKGRKGRKGSLFAPSEWDPILAEMRLLLKSVDGLLRGLAETELDRPTLASRAREAGTRMAVDVTSALMAKLPLPFKQVGLSIHKDMDALADAIIEGRPSSQ